MQWYEEILNKIKENRVYSHKELICELKKLRTDLSETTYHWAIRSLVRKGKLVRQGYNTYSLALNISKNDYAPLYSDTSKALIKLISEHYPYVQFTIFETVLMNEFLNHLIAQNTIFVQVEKESSIYVFRFLKESGYSNVIYKPSKKDLDLYWSKDCVIVTDMVSEAPLKPKDPHSIMIEKMLVDMISDKLIENTYSKAELPDVIREAKTRYFIDKVRMYRYSKRRNRYKVILRYFEN